ncbi:MAG: hemerythrin domain-containing protein [Elusimicrobia bacterium]|nr:hemerythrin domain-containing protein [Elusimicrobiota bacterium]
MNLVQILKEDHSFFRGRFPQLQTLARASEMVDNKPLVLSLVKELRKRHQIHIRRETEVLIPKLVDVYRKEKLKMVDSFLLLHLQEEHLTVGRSVYLLEQELAIQPPSLLWIQKLDKLVAAYIPHMDNEEKGLFPEAEKYLTPQQLEKMAYVPVSEDL